MKLLPNLKLIQQKITNLKKREQERLAKLANNEQVVFPRYFHATDTPGIATSIAHTGIEAIEASSGFGAFVSTNPELRYGSVILGLPEMVQTSSKQDTLYNRFNARAIHDADTRWAGLHELITINPRERLKVNLQRALCIAVRGALEQSNAPPHKVNEQEAAITAQILDKFLYRYKNDLGDGKRGWNLCYRDPHIKQTQPVSVISINELRTKVGFEIQSNPTLQNYALNDAL